MAMGTTVATGPLKDTPPKLLLLLLMEDLRPDASRELVKPTGLVLAARADTLVVMRGDTGFVPASVTEVCRRRLALRGAGTGGVTDLLEWSVFAASIGLELSDFVPVGGGVVAVSGIVAACTPIMAALGSRGAATREVLFCWNVALSVVGDMLLRLVGNGGRRPEETEGSDAFLI